MQIIAEVPLNLYRTPSKTVRATIQKKFLIYTYKNISMPFKSAARVPRGGENRYHFE